MKRMRYFEVTLITVVVALFILAAFTFFNFDHLTSGELKKVEVIAKETNSVNTLKTFTDKQDLKELTSIFFGKFNESIFLHTTEDSLLSVVFTFENKVIEFKLFSSSESGEDEYSYFKYPARKMRFSTSSNQRDRLIELIP